MTGIADPCIMIYDRDNDGIIYPFDTYIGGQTILIHIDQVLHAPRCHAHTVRISICQWPSAELPHSRQIFNNARFNNARLKQSNDDKNHAL